MIRVLALPHLRTDLPLDRDAGARFLPWIVGIMVFLAVLAAAVALMVERAADRWQRDLSSEITIELPAVAGEGTAEKAERIDAVLNELSETPGIAGTRLLDHAEVMELVSPWLDREAEELGVPLPDLIAVSLRSGNEIDVEDLQQRLTAVSHGAVVDDHAEFTASALSYLRSVELAALGVLGLVLVATASIIGFVARTGLAIHRRVIEVLHLFGAEDSYITRQFQTQAAHYGLLGAVMGGLGALLTLWIGNSLIGNGLASLATSGARLFELWMIVPLAIVPILAVAVAVATVHVAVMRALRRRPY